MIALIEINEDDLLNVGCPFILYGVYKTASNKKLSAAFRLLADLRKQIASQYGVIEKLQASNDDT